MTLSSLRQWARERVYPCLALVACAPLLVFAVQRSATWMGRVFPGFFVMENRVVSTVQAYDWMPAAGTAALQQVIAVDGVPVHSNREVYELVATRPPGTVVEYRLRSHDSEILLRIPTRRFEINDYAQTFGVLLLFGCASLFTALAVAFLQPGTTEARVYLFSGVVAGIYPICGTLLYHADVPAWCTNLYLIAEPLFPATWVHLAFVFPVATALTSQLRLWLFASYGISLVLITGLLLGFHSQPPNLIAAKVTWIYIAAAILFFFARMWMQSRHREITVRARARATFVGLVLATVPALMAFAINALPWRSVPQQFGLVLAPFFYLNIAYAIAKHDLFDVNRYVRQSVAYALLTAFVSAGYFAVLSIPELMMGAAAQQWQRRLGIAFVVLLALSFDRLRRLAQAIVDRAFFRTRLDYQATLSRVTSLMTTKLDRNEIVAAVTDVLTNGMFLELSALYVRELPTVLWAHTAGGVVQPHSADRVLPLLCNLAERHTQVWDAVALVQHYSDAGNRHSLETYLRELGIQSVFPLLFLDRCTGLLLLGARRSGHALEANDVVLLRTLADQAAIALHNAASYAALEESRRTLDDRVRQRTQELRDTNVALQSTNQALEDAQRQLVQHEKMASLGQIVAGVAHELNNPMSFVHGGLENLEDYVPRLVEILHAYEQIPLPQDANERIAALKQQRRLAYLVQATPALLQRCREGSDRVRRIVEDLRAFARADHGARHAVDVAESLEAALRTLAGRLHAQGVQVRNSYETVPPIEGRRDDLERVWTNLIANAIDAVAACRDPEIQVQVRPHRSPSAASDAEAGAIEVSITDNGSGIAADVQQKIYDPFFTTKPVGAGTGLGLSIVHSLVRQHDGTITCQSTPGSGTTFRVYLPVRRTPL